MRRTARVQRPQKMVSVQGVPLPATVGGWDGISPLANMPVDRAIQLDNWVARPGWIEPRRGSVVHATGIGLSNTPVQSVMAYNGFSSNKLFAVGGGNIYDCTNSGTATLTSVTGLGSSRMQHVMFSNAADLQFLVAVNGTDSPWIYNGTTWSQPAITVASGSNSFDPSTFIGVAAHQGRLWFVPKGSTDPVYMTGIGAISGDAYSFPLGQLMTKGGYLMAIGRWTIDTRQNVDEYIAFITSRGEVIVYAGTDPSTSTTWSLVGIYQVGAPIGRRCVLRISGDLQIITVDGIVGMSEMLSTDRAAANRVSLTSIIMNKISQAAVAYKSNFGWELQEFPLGTLAILNIPIQENAASMQFVMNTITGAWSRFIGLNPSTGAVDYNYGINANTWEVDSTDNIYWGGNNGTVYQWNVGMGDGSQPITCIVKGAYNSFGNAAQLKRYTALQALITSSGSSSAPTTSGGDFNSDFNSDFSLGSSQYVGSTPSIGINTDFNDVNILSTEQPITNSGAQWGQVSWNNFTWGVPAATSNNWLSVDGIGHYVSIVTKVTTYPNANNPSAYNTLQLNGWNITAESGAFI